ncbi:GlxA family transcriptional regulator [Pseudonocardia sp. GCM10023141]|uniref:GlxA family transcriptional regulator n=1 Tax=Pseudonocardia sp. GCM10023141 TaxID=3252653 RepID=UPI003609BC9E
MDGGNPGRHGQRRIAVLVFDGVRLLDVTGPLEVFDVARTLGAAYEIALCSPDGRDVTTSSGLRIGVEHAAGTLAPVDTLLVPGGECLVAAGPSRELVEAITALAADTRRVASVCAGAFALAAVGLLAGRRATTHWKHTTTLGRRFPTVTVVADAIYVRDGRVLTSAGVSAGIDLALALVEEDEGDETAHAIARDLVVFMRRLGAQPQLSVPARTTRPRRRPLRALCDEIAADPAADHCLTALAARAGMSERHLRRLFTEEVGCSPTAYVNAVRLEAALALRNAGETAASAARRSGMGSEQNLRRAVRRAAGIG